MNLNSKPDHTLLQELAMNDMPAPRLETETTPPKIC